MNVRLILFCLLLLHTTVLIAANKAPPPTPSELAASHGYVFVVLPKNRNAVESKLSIKRVGEKKSALLTKRTDATGDAYGAWLPAGEYVLASWDQYTWNEYAPIDVKAGQVTDLGTLLPVPVGAYKFVVLPLRPGELSNRVQAPIDEFKAILTTPEPLRWTPTATPIPFTVSAPSTGLGLVADLLMDHDRKVNKPPLKKRLSEAARIDDFLALAKTAVPPLSDQSASDQHENLYFGADLGQVRVRTADGNWSSLDTGTIEAITAVAIIDDRLFAGSRNGMMYVSRDFGAHWEKIAALDLKDEIAGISRVGSQWFIATLHGSTFRGLEPVADYFKLYAMNGDDFTQLRVVRENKMPGYLRFLWQGPAAAARNSTYYVSTGLELIRFDAATSEWKSITPPSGFSGFNVAANGGMIAAYTSAGMFSKLYLSNDRGDSWRKIDAPPYVVEDVYFEDANIGRAVRGRAGAFLVTKETMTYDSAKNKWNHNRDAPEGCIRILHDRDRQPKFCLTNGGSILNGSDDKWQLEFGAE